MDLALLIRPERSAEPVYPLHVAPTGPDDPARVAASEPLLHSAMDRAAAAGVPAIPLARLDASVAGGVLNAATEFHAGAIVMGWQAQNLMNTLLKSIPDRVVAQSRQAVLLFRPGMPLPASRRLWVMAPPLIEHHPGLPEALPLVRRLASHTGAKLRILAMETTRQVIAPLVRPAPAVETETPPTWPDWEVACAKLEMEATPGDTIVLLSVRRGDLAWRSNLERLPVVWARRWPEANLIVLFPPPGFGPGGNHPPSA